MAKRIPENHNLIFMFLFQFLKKNLPSWEILPPKEKTLILTSFSHFQSETLNQNFKIYLTIRVHSINSRAFLLWPWSSSSIGVSPRLGGAHYTPHPFLSCYLQTIVVEFSLQS
jgi:hypothetical protein